MQSIIAPLPNLLAERRLVGVVYSVYGDESHDKKCDRVFAVAGLFGSERDWDQLKSTWNTRTRGRIFHAADCETDAGDFCQSDHKENLKLYADLAQILAASNLLGFGTALSLDQNRMLFPAAVEHHPYYLCFNEVVAAMGDVASASIPRDKVEFVFDRKAEIEYNAGQLYDYMVNLPEWEGHEFLTDKISFATRKYEGIQAADLLARETMKHLDNMIGPVKRPTRESFKVLDHTKRFRFRFYMDEFFLDMKQKLRRLTRPGRSMIEYEAWRKALRLVDNTENRLRYHIHFESLERQKCVNGSAPSLRVDSTLSDWV